MGDPTQGYWAAAFEFARFWGRCIVAGWHTGNWIIDTAYYASFFLTSGLFVFKRISPQSWIDWETIVMKIAFWVFLGTFFLATFLIAPFLQYEQKPAVTKQIASTPKPLPDLFVPRPEPPPAPAPPVSTQQIVAVEAQPQLEVFSNDTDIADSVRAKITKLKTDTAARAKAAEQQQQLANQQDWDNGLRHYKHSLVVLHDVLLGEATKTGDRIIESKGYFDCMPLSIDPQAGEIKAATIGLNINTNVNFLIRISGLNGQGHRQMHISCAAGDLEIYPGMGNEFYSELKIYPDISLRNNASTDGADDLVADDVKSLVGAQLLISAPKEKGK